MTVAWDDTEELTGFLGSALFASASQTPSPDYLSWDCSIGGLKFLFGFSPQNPYKEETAEFRRQKVDTSTSPGEQSLDSGFWLRSQASWHYGAGLTSAEPLEVSDNESRFMFKQGGGVNPWTAGQVTLLNDTTNMFSSATASPVMLGVDTGVLHGAGSVLKYVPATGSPSTVTWGGSGTIQSLTSDGANYYVADSTGIYKGALPNGAGSLIWNTGSAPVVRWVKSRLMATVGKAIYELTGTGPTLPTALNTGTARPTGWVWNDIAEGPTAIYLSGYVGDQSVIEKVDVVASSSTITLSQPVVVAEMPRGEIIYSLYSYVGAYMVIGTNKGLRVASIATNGSLVLGPLVFSCADGVKDVVAQGQYVYATVGSLGQAGNRATRAGLYRVDLGTNVNSNPLDFAYAPDIVAASGTTGAATQVSIAGSHLYFCVDGSGVWKQNDTYVSTGWMETGRIRFGTLEPKAWREARVLAADGSVGTIGVYASGQDTTSPSTWYNVVNISGTTYDSYGSLNFPFPTPQSSLFAAFRLDKDGTTGGTPVFTGYQIRGIPAPRRSQMISLPVMLFDFETDKTGVKYGSQGGAVIRKQFLRDLEGTATTVQFIDYTTGESHEAYIEKVGFQRLTPPSTKQSGAGGIATILLRLV